MTWSIVAHDPATDAFAVAVATRAFAVGASCPFVRSGVGAVSTQSFTNRYLGPVILYALARGQTPDAAIEAPWPAMPAAASARCTWWTGTAALPPGPGRTASTGAAALLPPSGSPV